jgi:hypothetical protein
MPFDGTEITSLDGAILPLLPPARGRWGRLKRLCRSLRPIEWGAPAGQPSPAEPGPANDTLQVLRLARALIADERHWIQRRYETLDGRRCAVGALRGAARLMALRSGDNGPHTALLAVAVDRGFTDIEKMNDHSTHAGVLSAFDAAIVRVQLGL